MKELIPDSNLVSGLSSSSFAIHSMEFPSPNLMHHMSNPHMVMQMMMERYYAASPRVGYPPIPNYDIQSHYHSFPPQISPMVSPYETLKFHQHQWPPSSEFVQMRNMMESNPSNHPQVYAANMGKLRSQYIRANSKEVSVKKEGCPLSYENSGYNTFHTASGKAITFLEKTSEERIPSATDSENSSETYGPVPSPKELVETPKNIAPSPENHFSPNLTNSSEQNQGRLQNTSSKSIDTFRLSGPVKRQGVLDQIIMGNLKVEGYQGRGKAQQRREEIRQMLKFIVEQNGKISHEKMIQCSKIFKNDKKLCELYECLLVRYNSCVKTKEEKIKYVMRKCFKLMFERIENSEKIEDGRDKRTAEDIFYENYFLSSKDTLNKIMEKCNSKKKGADRNKLKGKVKGSDADLIKEDSYKDILIPFRKKSENKTMNKDYFTKIFAFEKFCQGYLDFLDKFCILAIRDNKVKFDTTVKKLESILNSSKPISFKGFKRMPWLLSWIEDSESIARKLTKFIDEKIMISHKLARQNPQKGFELEIRKRSNSL